MFDFTSLLTTPKLFTAPKYAAVHTKTSVNKNQVSARAHSMNSVATKVSHALTSAHKYKLLYELTQKRKQNTPENAYSIADFFCGAYECDWVSPYTKSASNLNSEVMIILQDWASKDYLCRGFKPELVSLGLDPKLPTSRQLNTLLSHHFNLTLKETFATNLYPFIKQGTLSAAMTWRSLLDCAKQYALPQIEIINPKVTICLGLNVFNALSVAAGGIRYKCLNDAIQAPFLLVFKNGQCSYVFAQAHTGFHGQSSRNRIEPQQVNLDWAAMLKHS
ncbi:hypothetical protein DZ860_03100 [Vibrio sinensis]|uniref:Uracil-DNA glycosylase-like domain-containing protein n=1 Tax=Vibrio sinensis TaxID=2302434 RepID=A0A3A6QWM6_9VIBR|nr:hypothetical protein [Vibrio sinensis]RJX75678.1 hypothetical protein DZ860_03100 [Vibrio sinensis]